MKDTRLHSSSPNVTKISLGSVSWKMTSILCLGHKVKKKNKILWYKWTEAKHFKSCLVLLLGTQWLIKRALTMREGVSPLFGGVLSPTVSLLEDSMSSLPEAGRYGWLLWEYVFKHASIYSCKLNWPILKFHNFWLVYMPDRLHVK